MPTIFIEGYKFRFYSSDLNEPPHVHVIRAERVAKIWLDSLEVEYNRGGEHHPSILARPANFQVSSLKFQVSPSVSVSMSVRLET